MQNYFCNSNQLTTLDVSKNTSLKTLQCYSNQLTSLDVSKDTSLTTLYCYSNQLTSLDLSKNTKLTSLRCYSNALPLVDLKNASAKILNTANKYLGTQTLPQATVNLNTSINADTVFNGVNTVFTVSNKLGGAVLGTDYSITGGIITFRTSGIYTVEITNPGITSDPSYPAKVIATYEANTKMDQTITWNQTLAATMGDTPITLTAAASSGLTVSYASSNPNVATISGNVLTIVGEGTATITASQNGDNIYNPAIFEKTLTVNKKTGIAEIEISKNKITVYPNPVVNGKLIIENGEWENNTSTLRRSNPPF